MFTFENNLKLIIMKLNNYKLRAECSSDVIGFITESYEDLTMFKMETPDINFPDVEFEFTTWYSLEYIIKILRRLEDSHVMIQTVNLLGNYTGVRNYELE